MAPALESGVVVVRTQGRLGRSLQTALVAALTALLFGVVLVAVPGLVPPSLARLLGWGQPAVSGSLEPGSYVFMEVQPGTTDVPVTYNHCTPLHYVVNYDGAPPSDPKASFVFAAVRRVSQVSGFRFVYDGPSTHPSMWKQPREQGPIQFDFDDTRTVSKYHDAAAIGGSVAIDRGAWKAYATGEVTFDRAYFAMADARPGGGDEARAIAMHELGHVLGLAHATAPGEIMDARGSGQYELGRGDITGLKILGASRCN